MRRWTLGVGALAALLVTWIVWPVDGPAVTTEAPAQVERALAASAGAERTTAREAPPKPGTRPILVDVVGCRGRPAQGVLVLARLGVLELSARTNEAGQARIAVPETSGLALVRVRLASRETASVPATGDHAEVSACPGATVSGRVVDETGLPLAGLAVRVVDATDAALDEVEVDDEGRYALSDGTLDGAALVVETPAGPEVRPLAPLAPGETRTVDIVVGRLHEVVGWVLDLSGEAQPGVAVTMRAQEFGSVWATTTDAKGAFRFGFAPQAPVRIDADAGELGRASVRLAGSATRREVSLTLEPAGDITVLAHDADGKNVEGTVVVRCSAETYHGEDPLWADMLDAPVTAEVDPSADAPEIDVDAEAPPRDTPDVATVMTALEAGLRDFDPSTPADSMKRLVRTMLQEVPELARELPSDVQGESMDAMVDAMTEQALREDPSMLDQIALAAEHVQNGASLEEAMRMARAAREPAEEERERRLVEEAESGVDSAPIEPEPFEGEPEGMGDAVVASDWYDADPDQRTIVARGALAEAIPLRGSFVYWVYVVRPDGKERVCGNVYLHPGESLTVSCGVPSKARITGRVVDSRGQPIAHLNVVTFVEYESQVATESDANGRFELVATVDRGQTTTLEVTDPTVRLAVSTRRNIMVLPGEVQDVGDIVVRTLDEVPEGLMSKPFGGIGGYISLNDNGVFLDNIEPETPLAYEGVEPGDEILMIDGVSAGELSMDDVLERLRGEPGTGVALRIRSKGGELFEVDLTRGMIRPHAANANDGAEYPDRVYETY